MLLKSKSDELIVSLLQELQGVFVSQLDELELSQDLGVDDSQIIIDGLVEDHVIYMSVDLFSDCSNPFNTVDIDVL